MEDSLTAIVAARNEADRVGETVDVLDTSNNVLDTHTLSSFVGGTYLVWNVTGHVKIRVTSLNPTSVNTNSVINGIFFR